MSRAVEFFAPTSPFGAFTGWVIQTGGNPSVAQSLAVELGADGDEIAHVGYDKKESVTCNYVLNLATGNITIPKIGQVLNGYHIDSVSVTFSQTTCPKMSVTGHKHLAGNVDEKCRTYSPVGTFAARSIGIPSSVTGVFTKGSTTSFGMRSLTIALALNHVDELDGEGGHLDGDNYDGTETVTVEFTGNVTIGTDVTVDDSFFLQTDAKGLANTTATTSTLTLIKHLTHDTTAGA